MVSGVRNGEFENRKPVFTGESFSEGFRVQYAGADARRVLYHFTQGSRAIKKKIQKVRGSWCDSAGRCVSCVLVLDWSCAPEPAW